MPQTLKSIVVQVDVGLQDFRVFERIRIDGKVVIVRRDLDLAGFKLLYRMVPAVMAELEFVCLAAKGQSDQLMAKTNTKDRCLAHQAANVIRGVGAWLGIAGTVGEKYSVRVE